MVQGARPMLEAHMMRIGTDAATTRPWSRVSRPPPASSQSVRFTCLALGGFLCQWRIGARAPWRSEKPPLASGLEVGTRA